MKNRNTVFHLILLLVGISGILTYVFDIEDLICKRQLVVLAAMAPCLLFWGMADSRETAAGCDDCRFCRLRFSLR